MKIIRTFFAAVFYWTYSRGSWQWDISCLVFILIIFTTPHDFLESYTKNPMTSDQIRAAVANFLKSIL